MPGGYSAAGKSSSAPLKKALLVVAYTLDFSTIVLFVSSCFLDNDDLL